MSEGQPTPQKPERTIHTQAPQPKTRNAIIQLTSLDRYTGLRNHRMRFVDAVDVNGERVDKPNKQDIIFGRGKSLQDLPGNKRMRLITNKYKAIYRRLPRSQKRNLVETVYREIVCNDARFLTKAPNGTHYLLVDVEVALQKISNSLRCMKAHKRRLLTARERQSSSEEPVPTPSLSTTVSSSTPQQQSCRQAARRGDAKPSPSKETSKPPNSLNLCSSNPGTQNLDIMTTLLYLNQCKRLRLTMGARMMSSMAICRSIRLQSAGLSLPRTEATRGAKSNPT